MVNKFNFIIFIVLLISCSKYETRFDGPYDTSLEHEEIALEKSLLFASESKFYLSNDYGYYRIGSDDSLDVKMASINNIHTKVLFKEDNKDIVIFDVATLSIERTIEGSSAAIFFDYHPNNESIYYFVEDGLLYVDGPQLYNTNPLDMSANLSVSSTASFDFLAAVILPNNDIITFFESGWSNFKRIARISETEQINLVVAPENIRHMRINHSGTLLHARSSPWTFGYKSCKIDINTLEVDFDNYLFSLPHSYLSDTVGCYVDEDAYLYVPPYYNNTFVNGGGLSSLDY